MEAPDSGPSQSVPEVLAEALGDRYSIERELVSGGMATVYLARDQRHDRSVAIKVMHTKLATVLGAERFRRDLCQHRIRACA